MPRADARRNAASLLDAAASVFLASGVHAPVREIAARAGVGIATIYRHYPTRADLIVAVYRHQIDACAAAGPKLLETAESPYEALAAWVDAFVDFLVTKHGLAEALHSDDPSFQALHEEFLDRLLPVCSALLRTAAADGQIRADVTAYAMLRAIGNLCIGAGNDSRYNARQMVAVLLNGLSAPVR